MNLAKIENINTIANNSEINESKEPEINSQIEPRKSKSKLWVQSKFGFDRNATSSIITVIEKFVRKIYRKFKNVTQQADGPHTCSGLYGRLCGL